ncbi:PepSY-associated TM helix domain-containing protein [Sulfitobacter aestuarii]|uniref:PepSY-associated TM helix domain-containing protein n=1 Tax=Sulfitobacter aestuarii TaxID=2161676 RepID=A0ABW5U719_9RHOB
MVSTDSNMVPDREDAARPSNKFYFAAWRWHFYAGLYVIPFFIMLALTGLAMLWIAYLGGRDGEHVTVVPQEQTLAISTQAEAALASMPGGELKQYIAPRAADMAASFRVDLDGAAYMVVVDPYTAEVLASFARRTGWYDMAEKIHGTLMIGVTGDRMIEIAASLGMVLVATGLYLWWPRDTGWRAALVPTLGRGRGLWKSLHGVIGIWVSLFLVMFLLSGLAWSGVWGEKIVQAFSKFPAEKWENVPLSDDIHAKMNHGPKDVPWALEQVQMPASGSDAGSVGISENARVTIDTVDALAREIGFDGRYQLNLPDGDAGVWTLSRDSMSNDDPDPTSDRTVHLDRFTGKILADVRFADYGVVAKLMALGTALHMGTLGLWSVLANSAVCLSVLLLCVSGMVMWWKRRPVAARRLAAPPMPRDMPLWQGAVLVGLAMSLAFPMAGLTLIVVLALDLLLLSRLPGLKRLLT